MDMVNDNPSLIGSTGTDPAAAQRTADPLASGPAPGQTQAPETSGGAGTGGALVLSAAQRSQRIIEALQASAAKPGGGSGSPKEAITAGAVAKFLAGNNPFTASSTAAVAAGQIGRLMGSIVKHVGAIHAVVIAATGTDARQSPASQGYPASLGPNLDDKAQAEVVAKINQANANKIASKRKQAIPWAVGFYDGRIDDKFDGKKGVNEGTLNLRAVAANRAFWARAASYRQEAASDSKFEELAALAGLSMFHDLGNVNKILNSLLDAAVASLGTGEQLERVLNAVAAHQENFWGAHRVLVERLAPAAENSLVAAGIPAPGNYPYKVKLVATQGKWVLIQKSAFGQLTKLSPTTKDIMMYITGYNGTPMSADASRQYAVSSARNQMNEYTGMKAADSKLQALITPIITANYMGVTPTGRTSVSRFVALFKHHSIANVMAQLARYPAGAITTAVIQHGAAGPRHELYTQKYRPAFIALSLYMSSGY